MIEFKTFAAAEEAGYMFAKKINQHGYFCASGGKLGDWRIVASDTGLNDSGYEFRLKITGTNDFTPGTGVIPNSKSVRIHFTDEVNNLGGQGCYKPALAPDKWEAALVWARQWVSERKAKAGAEK